VLLGRREFLGRRGPVASAMAAAALVALTPAAALAGASGPGPVLPTANATSLVQTVAPQQAVGHSVTLKCSPAGGTHPNAAGACTALDSAGGDFEKLAPTTGRMCPHLVHPVTVSAMGTYRSVPVVYTKTFNNSCEMDRATHPLFDF
jgi:hypothetical protein